VSEGEQHPPRLTRLELFGLVGALLVLVAFGATFGVALLPRPRMPWAELDDGPGNPASSYRAEQEVDAWHAGRWYPAHVHSASAGRYFITYDGFSVSWHEWVSARRLRPRR